MWLHIPSKSAEVRSSLGLPVKLAKMSLKDCAYLNGTVGIVCDVLFSRQ